MEKLEIQFFSLVGIASKRKSKYLLCPRIELSLRMYLPQSHKPRTYHPQWFPMRR